jgi:uncharacterized metal-binding protein YceD (DUF177 family)
MSRKPDAPEFSFVIRPADLGAEPARYTLEASAEERTALAARFDLIDLEALIVEMTVEWLCGRAFLKLDGRIRANAVQRCVVTLQPVASRIDQRFEIMFEAGDTSAKNVVVEFEDVEPLPGEALDIGEVAAEEFALMLDPYPRVPGAALRRAGFGPGKADKAPESGSNDSATAGAYRPFEVLAALKRNK